MRSYLLTLLFEQPTSQRAAVISLNYFLTRVAHVFLAIILEIDYSFSNANLLLRKV